MSQHEIQVNDVVQISPDARVVPGLLGMFAVVTEVRSWGILADVLVPERGVSPVRLVTNDFSYIGHAQWPPI